MKKGQYIDILKENLKIPARELGVGRCWTFMQDNDQKNTSKFAQKRLMNNKINIFPGSHR